MAPPPLAGALPLPNPGLTKLKTLSLCDTQISDAGCAALVSALDNGGDDKTKLLEGDGTPGKEAKEAPKKKGKPSFEERKAAGKKNQLAKAAAKDDKHAAKLEMVPTTLTLALTLTPTPTPPPPPTQPQP